MWEQAYISVIKMWRLKTRKGFGNLSEFDITRIKEIANEYGISSILTPTLMNFTMRLKRLKKEQSREDWNELSKDLENEYLDKCQCGITQETQKKLREALNRVVEWQIIG